MLKLNKYSWDDISIWPIYLEKFLKPDFLRFKSWSIPIL